jgi:UDP-glucose 4-epimerase
VNVLVTGATAPLGEALVGRLLQRDDVGHVLAVGRNPEPAAEMSSPRLTYMACDLARERDTHDLLYGGARRLAIDTVIHGALHRSARDAGHRVHAANVDSTRHLLTACAGHPTVCRFVFRSAAEVYHLSASEPTLLDEDQPLEFDPAAPQWIRDRVEADLTACTRIGRGGLAIAVLRCAEVLAPGVGSQLWDYLGSRVCLRPFGFDPIVNLLSPGDAVTALVLASISRAEGVFNIPGADTLPLSAIVARFQRRGIALPGPLLAPLYRLRAATVGFEFRYDLNFRRFHFGGITDGTRARRELGYEPRLSIDWRALARELPTWRDWRPAPRRAAP